MVVRRMRRGSGSVGQATFEGDLFDTSITLICFIVAGTLGLSLLWASTRMK